MTTHTHHIKAMVAQLDAVRSGHSLRDTFTDFVAMAAIAIRNSFDQAGHSNREDEYQQLIRRYRPEKHGVFSQVLASLAEALAAGPFDVLGRMYMELGVASSSMGQYFTPPSISELLGLLALDQQKIQAQVQRRGYITLCDPASGSGALVMGFATRLQEMGFNYQQCMHATLVDVDRRAVQMAYVQLSLLHIPAVIVHGNSLTLQEFDHWCTPCHAINNFNGKLKRGFALDSELGRELTGGNQESRTGPQLVDFPLGTKQPAQGCLVF